MQNPRLYRNVTVLLALCLVPLYGKKKQPRNSEPSALDRYIQEATTRPEEMGSPGSAYAPTGNLAALTRDARSVQVNDIVTVRVTDSASAVSTGGTTTSRKSSAKYSIGSFLGATKTTGPLSQLANTSGDTELKGQGQTSRQSTLTTTLSARVTHVMPNGNLVIEGVKDLCVNSERQVVKIRGVVRPTDLSSDNTIVSDRIAMLEVEVNGKGVVSDAVRRPFFLYRILLGLLPF